MVTPFGVDHSCFGSAAYLLEADGKTRLYSGNLRMHGRKPGMIQSLVEAIAPRKIDSLIMEWTHLRAGRGRGKIEYNLVKEIDELIAAAPKLVLASF